LGMLGRPRAAAMTFQSQVRAVSQAASWRRWRRPMKE
jgi:hypothetical protein